MSSFDLALMYLLMEDNNMILYFVFGIATAIQFNNWSD